MENKMSFQYQPAFYFQMENYTKTIIIGKNGKYMYNPERIGDRKNVH